MLSWLVHQSRYERQTDALVTASTDPEPVLSCRTHTIQCCCSLKWSRIKALTGPADPPMSQVIQFTQPCFSPGLASLYGRSAGTQVPLISIPKCQGCQLMSLRKPFQWHQTTWSQADKHQLQCYCNDDAHSCCHECHH